MKSPQLTRRQILEAAGGITFLAVLPGKSLAAMANLASSGAEATLYPVFTALPYLQPGANSRLIDGSESVTIAWQTDAVPAQYTISYGVDAYDRNGHVESHLRTEGYGREKDKRINYVAVLPHLDLGRRYRYRVSMNGERLVEGFFTTRKPRGSRIRFVAFGDNSNGDISDRAIAFQAFRARPDFVMNTGDLVYPDGRENEYGRFFFPVYNADEAGPRIGAPLLRAVPLYTVMANHDINGDDPAGRPIVDFDAAQDALGYFTNLHLPLNGPAELSTPTPVQGKAERQVAFREVAGSRFPRMANYSYDYGDAHFLCLDSNTYVDPTDPALQNWIQEDLHATDARWKFVVCHHPPFNVGREHYTQQHMRVLAPIFEREGVDIVLSGHEHNYQRTQPMRFRPTDVSRAKATGSGQRLVPGEFTVDRSFNGRTVNHADGVIYITTGAGGHILYDPEMNDSASARRHPEDGNIDYVAQMVSDRHSLSVFDLDGDRLTLRQIDEWGQLIDRVEFRK